MRVAVTGAGGLLGAALVPLWCRAGERVVGWTRDLDVTDPAAVLAAVESERPDVLVHAAAYTDVERAESEPELAWRVNRDGTAAVAEACRRAGAVMVYVSTDYVFGGGGTRSPIPADAEPAPINAYGRSKAAGEAAVRESGAANLIVRSGWLYGPGRNNFVDTIRAAALQGRDAPVVNDQWGAPTAARLLAEALLALVREGVRGCWHVAASGEATWYDVAIAVYEACGSRGRVIAVSTAQRGGRAPRPAYTVLDCSATERRLATRLPPWKEQVTAYVTGEAARVLGAPSAG
jgi:dTDP-4-dehydrorhamnose reductase